MVFYYKMANNNKIFLDYEIFCMNEHQNHYNQKTYHWKGIGEDILENSGFIHNYNEVRLKRKSKWEEKNIIFVNMV